MYLEGRPPVTNLYSSAIFIGWGAVVLGMVLEKIYRDGIGSVVAAFVGFVTLIIAHNLALSGDTMEMMRAVLDTNFWLATHVVVVTLGYASTFLAGFLAIIYILRGLFTTTLSRGNRQVAWRGWSTASSASPRCSALSAPSWAASGPTSPGAGSGAGTRRRTARCSSCSGTPSSCTRAGAASCASAAS